LPPHVDGGAGSLTDYESVAENTQHIDSKDSCDEIKTPLTGELTVSSSDCHSDVKTAETVNLEARVAALEERHGA
jgi:hypothetical protein